MSSFVQEFKKYQKQERLLTAVIVLISILAPISFTWLMDKKVHWIISGAVALTMLCAAAAVHLFRSKVSEKLLQKYQTLDVGYILAKKLVPNRSTQRFVITNKGFNHYYLKSLNTGEQMLVSKHRVREDFDIAN